MTTLGLLLFTILLLPKDGLSRLSDSFDKGFNSNMDGSAIKAEAGLPLVLRERKVH